MILAAADLTAPASGPEAFPVGRILVDESRRLKIAERGEDVWQVAVADNSGLEAAWAAVLDEEGTFRVDEFDAPADPVIYLYRFKLHEDFSAWQLAVLDACCRAFGEGALVLAQHHTTWVSEAEFELLGFRLLPRAQFSARQDRRPRPLTCSVLVSQAIAGLTLLLHEHYVRIGHRFKEIKARRLNVVVSWHITKSRARLWL